MRLPIAILVLMVRSVTHAALVISYTMENAMVIILVIYSIFKLSDFNLLVCNVISGCDHFVKDASSIKCSKCKSAFAYDPIDSSCTCKKSLTLKKSYFLLACQQTLPNCIECSDEWTCTKCKNLEFQISNGKCRSKKNLTIS